MKTEFGAFVGRETGKRTLTISASDGFVLITAPPVEMKLRADQARTIAGWLDQAAASITREPANDG